MAISFKESGNSGAVGGFLWSSTIGDATAFRLSGKIPDRRNPPEMIAGVIDVFYAILNNLAKLCWLTALPVVCVNVSATRFHPAFNGPKSETSSARRRWEEWGGRQYKRI